MRLIKTVLVIVGIVIFLVHPGARAQNEDWYDEGRKLLSQQRYDEAIEAFSTAIDIIPRDYQSYNFRGICLALQGNFDQAIADYSRAIEIRPTYDEAYNNRGFAYSQTGNLKAALNDYSRALEINPFYADAYNNKAWLLATCSDQRIRNGGQAVQLAQKAVELRPDVSSLDTLAAAHAAAGDFESAIETQKKAIQKLLLAEKTAEVPKYVPRLKSYKLHRALLIDYTAKSQTPKIKNTKSSLKARTKETPGPTEKSKVAAKAAKAPEPVIKASKKKTRPQPAAVSVKKAAAKTSPKPAAAPPKTVAAATSPKPAAAPAVKKTSSAVIKPQPYTIQVSAFRDPQQSIQVARKLSSGGDPAYTSPVDISGKGKWYRVYIGNYSTLTEAENAAKELKRRKFRYVNISKKPYTVQVGGAVPKDIASKVQSSLQAKGYFSYRLPAAAHPNRFRILIGAFKNEKAATDLVRQLKADGFSPGIALK